MKVSSLKEKEKMRFKQNIFSDTNLKEQSKKSKKEKSEKSTTKEREKEKIEKEKKKISENKAFIKEKNEQSKDCFINNILENENFIANKEIKLQKTYKKKYLLRDRISKAHKKKVYNSILGSEKNAKFQSFGSNFATIDIQRCGTDDKIQKFSEKYRTDSEKIEISKIYELSTNKIMIRSTEEIFFEYSKKGKNKEQKSEEIELYRSFCR